MGAPNPDRSAKRPEWREHRTLRQLRADGFKRRAWCSSRGNTQLVDVDYLMERSGEDGSGPPALRPGIILQTINKSVVLMTRAETHDPILREGQTCSNPYR